MTTRTSSELPTWYRDLSLARVISGSPEDCTSIAYDSRGVERGGVFVAVPGLKVDGNDFIPDAISAGASSIIVQEDLHARWKAYINEDITFVAVPDSRVALAEAAAGFYGHPARTLGMIGVTGTDGKTTTTHLIAHVLNETNRQCGYLSSVEFSTGQDTELNASHMTTLEATEVQRHLARIKASGSQYAVVEASSIGLDLHRLDLCEFDVGVFTNLTPDHLDYHQTMAAYRDAKAILFRMLNESVDKGYEKVVVLNADDPASDELWRWTDAPALMYGLRQGAELIGSDIRRDGFGTRFTAKMFDERVTVRFPLLGEYNVSNALAAVGVAASQGVPFRDAMQAVESFKGMPGRMELIDAGQPFRVVVDIASTEQAMRNVLRILKPATKGRLIVVFGAAGERDRERRHGIARAVAGLADFAVITNEDPRSEDPQAIVDEIASALRASGWREGGKFMREFDRRLAISMAFAKARKGDTVLLAGKGTEQSIVMGNTHWPWDERAVARELLHETFER